MRLEHRMRRRRAAALVNLALLVASADAAHGQDAPKPAPTLPDKVRPVDSAHAPKLEIAPGACPFAGQGLKITLKKVTVAGATVLRQREVDRAVADLTNRNLDLGVICVVRDRIARLFADKGYRLTRVDVTPQTIHDGELRLDATEGYVAAVDTQRLRRMGPSAGLARSIFDKLAPAGPVTTHKPTRWDDIERAVLLARDIPGAEIGVRLHAAPDGPGALELVAVAPDRRKFDITTGVQDLGSEELGQVAGFVRLDANSFTSLAERSSLILYGTTTGRQKVAENVESVALGSSGLRADTDITYASTMPRGRLAPLGLNGDFFDAKAGVTYPWARSESFDLRSRLGFEFIDQRNSLGALQGANGSVPLLFRDKLRIATLQTDLRWRPAALKALDINAELEVRQGIEGLGSSRAGDPDLSRAQGKPSATVVRATASARWTFGNSWLAPRVLGSPWIQLVTQDQYATEPVLAYEAFQIGNYTIGRGYDPGAASADRAVGGQAEAGWPLHLPWVAPEPFVFYDAARLENINGAYTTNIASFGGGVRAALPWSLRLEVYAGVPLEPALPNTPKPAPRLLATVTRVFSVR